MSDAREPAATEEVSVCRGCRHSEDDHLFIFDDAAPCEIEGCDCAHYAEYDPDEDAKPTLAKVGAAVLWHGPYILLADLPEGHRAMVYREAGGWLVGTDDQLDGAKALIDAARDGDADECSVCHDHGAIDGCIACDRG